MTRIEYRISPEVGDEALNRLFGASWPGHLDRAFSGVLSRSLLYACAFDGDRLVGFVNVAWDGGLHGFLLDTTVLPEYRLRGIGRRLVRSAAEAAATRGLEWLHVDYDPHLEGFYQGCGFKETKAGLLRFEDASGGSADADWTSPGPPPGPGKPGPPPRSP